MEQQKHLVMTEDGRVRLIVTRRPPNRVLNGVLIVVFLVLAVLFILGGFTLKATGASIRGQGMLVMCAALGLVCSALTSFLVRRSLPDEVEVRVVGHESGRVIRASDIVNISLVPNFVLLVLLWSIVW